MKYRLLVVKDGEFMTPEVARKISQLVEAGAVVISAKPEMSPSLSGYPGSDKQIASIADKVWGSSENAESLDNSYGRGRIISDKAPQQVLEEMGIDPDFKYESDKSDISFTHRIWNGADIYFVANSRPISRTVDCSFRVCGKKPQIWDPLTGRISPAPLWHCEDNRTTVTLEFGPSDSYFVVFGQPVNPEDDQFVSISSQIECRSSLTAKDAVPYSASIETTGKNSLLKTWHPGEYTLRRASGKKTTICVESVPEPYEIKGPWNVRFPSGLGAPDKVELDELISWTKHSNKGVRYFSGTATYSTEFDLPAGFIDENSRLVLDLGEVFYIGHLKLNGNNLGILWKKPFREDITGHVKKGTNRLEIAVTNLWPNRLIGDEQYPEDQKWKGNVLNRRVWGGKYLAEWPEWFINDEPRPYSNRVTFTTWKHWDENDPLITSGLLGPVKVRQVKTINVE
jgi:hypothetical protein